MATYANGTYLRIGTRDGGAIDGTSTYSGSPTQHYCYVESYTDTITKQTLDATARCDSAQTVDILREKRTIRMTLRVPIASGYVFKALLDKYVELGISVDAGTTTETIADMAITEWSGTSPNMTDYITESVTLEAVVG
jgi:hypothetical protein